MAMRKLTRFGLGFVAFLAGGTGAQAAGTDAREVLPGTVVPIHYDLQLSPDAGKLIFKGHVAITVQVNAPVSEITVNQDGLTFAKATLDQTALALTPTDAKLGRETLRAPKA